MGHIRWLPKDLGWRNNKKSFDAMQEMGLAPIVPDGDEIMRQLKGVEYVVTKLVRRRHRICISCSGEQVIWKKQSIFFTLPY
jgi:hypothetical protein